MPIDLSTIPSAVGLPDEHEQRAIDARVRELSTAAAGNLAGVHRAITAAERRFSDEATATADRMSPAERPALKAAAQKVADCKLHEYRTKVIQESTRDREDMLRQLGEAHARLDLAVRATPTAVSMLGMTALGSEQRQRYEAQLSGAGPATLGNAAIRAVATGDAALGAAVLARLDAMPKDQRPVQPQDLAEKLVGARHRDLMQRAERARIAVHAAREGDRALRLGAMDGFGKISRGLATRKLAGAAQD